jgi:hypothetical protein
MRLSVFGSAPATPCRVNAIFVVYRIASFGERIPLEWTASVLVSGERMRFIVYRWCERRLSNVRMIASIGNAGHGVIRAAIVRNPWMI